MKAIEWDVSKSGQTHLAQQGDMHLCIMVWPDVCVWTAMEWKSTGWAPVGAGDTRTLSEAKQQCEQALREREEAQ